MGQKINPISLRLQNTNRFFDSCWYSDYYYTNLLINDFKIRFYIDSILKQIEYPSGRFFIQTLNNKTNIFLFFCNPNKSRKIRFKLFNLKQYKKIKEKRQTINSISVKNKHCTSKAKYEKLSFTSIIESINKANQSLSHINTRHQRAKFVQSSATKMVDLQNGSKQNSMYIQSEKLKKEVNLNDYMSEATYDGSTMWLLINKVDHNQKYGIFRYFLLHFILNNKKKKDIPFTSLNYLDTILDNRYIKKKLEYLKKSGFSLIKKSENYDSKLKKINVQNKFGLKTKSKYSELEKFGYKKYNEPRAKGSLAIYGATPKLINSEHKHSKFKGYSNNYKPIREYHSLNNLHTNHHTFLSKNHLGSSKLPKYDLVMVDGVLQGNRRALINFVDQQHVVGILCNKTKPARSAVRYKSSDVFINFVDQQPTPCGCRSTQDCTSCPTTMWWEAKYDLLHYVDHSKSKKNIITNQKQEILRLYKPIFSTALRMVSCFYGDLRSRHCLDRRSPSSTRQALCSYSPFGLKSYIHNKVNMYSSLAMMSNKTLISSYKPHARDNKKYRNHIEKVLTKELKFNINIHPIKIDNDFRSALFLADEIVYYIQRRVPFRKIKNRILKECKSFSQIKGLRLVCSGRVGGRSKKAQRSKTESIKYGQTSLHIFSSRIDFASRTAFTPFGSIGVKVWICFR